MNNILQIKENMFQSNIKTLDFSGVSTQIKPINFNMCSKEPYTQNTYSYLLDLKVQNKQPLILSVFDNGKSIVDSVSLQKNFNNPNALINPLTNEKINKIFLFILPERTAAKFHCIGIYSIDESMIINHPVATDPKEREADRILLYNFVNSTAIFELDKVIIAEAQKIIGSALCFGNTKFGQNPSRGLFLLESAIQKGNDHASISLGKCYKIGISGGGDIKAADEHFLKAFNNKTSDGCLELGICYEHGVGTDKNFNKALDMYEKAVKGANPSPVASYCWAALREKICLNKFEEATQFPSLPEDKIQDLKNELDRLRGDERYAFETKLLRTAAESGYTPAFSEVAYRLRTGIGNYPNGTFSNLGTRLNAWVSEPVSSEKFLNEGVRRNDPSCLLSMSWNNGMDEKQKFNLVYAAAMQGHTPAEMRLAECYRDGIGTTIDAQEAINYYHKAAVKGYRDAEHYLVGLTYFSGLNVAIPDYYKWIESCQSLPNAQADSKKFFIAYCKENRIYNDLFAKNQQTEAVAIYEELARNGHLEAQTRLAICKQRGIGTRQDLKEAASLFQKAADAKVKSSLDGYHSTLASYHSTLANFHLGQYYEGRGCDYRKAVQCYTLAAQQNWPRALFLLGLCKEKGRGTPANFPEAFHLYKLAAAQGYEEAQVRVEFFK